MNSKEFTEKYLLNEVKLIEAANVRLHLLSAIVHGIETAGARLDSLPFKAKGQGKKRFGLALRTLFPNHCATVTPKLDALGTRLFAVSRFQTSKKDRASS